MSVPRSPDQAASRMAHHSINFYVGTGLIVPVACLTVLWGLVTAVVLIGFRHRWHWLVSAGQAHPALAGAAKMTAHTRAIPQGPALVIRLCGSSSPLIKLMGCTRSPCDLAIPSTLRAVVPRGISHAR